MLSPVCRRAVNAALCIAVIAGCGVPTYMRVGDGASQEASAGGTGGRDVGGAPGSGGTILVGSGGVPGSGGAPASGGTAGGGGRGSGGAGSGGRGSGGAGGAGSMCPSRITPATGLVTEFADWSAAAGKWGPAGGLQGGRLAYAGTSSTAAADVDATAQNLRFTANVVAGGYAGGGITFDTCASAGTNTAVQFSLLGSTGGCVLEYQVQTFSQRPTTEVPPGGCTGTCRVYPRKAGIATPTSATVKTMVIVRFSELLGWTAANHDEVVGMVWQVTSPPTDGGVQLPCAVDMRVDDVRFVTAP
jgi:hypothetical protein